MKKIDELLLKLYVKAHCTYEDLKNSERGDTNFISLLVILGFVVVLAGVFMTLGNNIMDTIKAQVEAFISNLGGNTPAPKGP